MSTTYNPTGSQTQTKNIQPSDIKSLVQRQGRATINDKEVVLKSPAASDPQLQEIVKDPSLAVKSTGSTGANGETEYELSANGKSVKITINRKNSH